MGAIFRNGTQRFPKWFYTVCSHTIVTPFKTKINNQVNASIQRVKDGSHKINFGEGETTMGPVFDF